MNLYWSSIFFSFWLFIFDRLTKHFILKIPESGIFVLPQVQFKLYLNPGLAFSLPLPNLVNLLLAVIVILLIISFLLQEFKKHQVKYFLPLLLILTGSFSNLIDRLYFGGVIDFISIAFWPAFNLADSYIVGGLILLLLTFNYSSGGFSKTVTGNSDTEHDFSK